MPENGTHQEIAERLEFPESVRLLWEGTQKALEEWGMDPDDVASLCDIVIRLADHRLMVIKTCGSPPGSGQIAEQVILYRDLASRLLQRAAASPSEPNWKEVANKLRLAGVVTYLEE